MDTLECKQCNGTMKRGKKVESSLAIQLIGVILFITGFCLLFIFPIGTLIGIILMIASGRMGYKRINGWKCKQCGYFFEAEK